MEITVAKGFNSISCLRSLLVYNVQVLPTTHLHVPMTSFLNGSVGSWLCWQKFNPPLTHPVCFVGYPLSKEAMYKGHNDAFVYEAVFMLNTSCRLCASIDNGLIGRTCSQQLKHVIYKPTPQTSPRQNSSLGEPKPENSTTKMYPNDREYIIMYDDKP